MTRRFFVRTFGCQMNEHDSERIAGLLAAEGMEPTDDLEAADVVVLNTCCIRENADNKLYGHLGHLKSLKDARPDLQIAVGGCLAQKDRDWLRRAGAARRRRVRHPQPRPRARAARPRAARRADRRDPRGARGVPVGAARAPRGRPLGLGDDPDRLRQLVRVLHRAVGARPRGQPAHGRHRARGRDARRRRRLRDHAARPERELLRPRPRRGPVPARSSPTCCAPSTRSTASNASGSRRRTRRISGPRRSRRWPSARRVCEHLHLPLQSGSDRTLARMHRGYTADALPRTARGRARRDPRPRGHHRHHRRLPGRDRRRLRAHARSRRPRPSTTRPTRSCSRPGRAPKRRRWSTTSSRPRSCTSAWSD